jgi:peptidoglycan hydrolase CwlO-like protein
MRSKIIYTILWILLFSAGAFSMKVFGEQQKADIQEQIAAQLATQNHDEQLTSLSKAIEEMTSTLKTIQNDQTEQGEQDKQLAAQLENLHSELSKLKTTMGTIK